MTNFAARMSRVKPSAIRELLALGADHSVLSFGGGYPDPTLFPIEDLAEIFSAALCEQGEVALQYGASAGLPRLRQQIAERMTADGTPCASDEVLIVQGAQQGLDLVAKMMIDRGSLVLVEDPTFLGALIAFNPYEPRYATVAIDENGLCAEALDALFQRERPALLYTMPDFQNPTGVSMSLARRQTLVESAARHGVLVVEDSPYRDLRYEGAPMPTLKSLDRDDNVIHIGSFSKTLAPALRLGWVVASQPIIDKLSLLKLAADTQCSTLNMTAVSLYLDRCDVATSLDRMRATYLRKKSLMLDMIRSSFPKSVTFTDPQGGLFTWLTFPDGFDAARFMKEHALPEARVAYVPGASFFALDERVNHARLSFATQSDDAIVRGISALGALLHAHI